MRVSIVIRDEMMGEELQNSYVEGVFRDNSAAYTLAGKLEFENQEDHVYVTEQEVLDDPS